MQNKKEIIGSLIQDFLQKPIRRVLPRKQRIVFNKKLRKVHTVIWPRRAGKSYFCFQTISQFLKQGVKKEDILFFNLETDEVDIVDTRDLNLILEVFFEIVWYDEKRQYYIFLDEIQNIRWWEKFVRKVLDNFDNIELVITWSSSKLLSKEIATSLRWRSLIYEIFPLSFDEFLQWTDLKKKYLSTAEKIKFNRFKNNFLNWWSFPEIVIAEYSDEINKILKDYFDLIFYKDVIERYGFKDIKKLKDFRRYLLSFVGDFFSFSNIEKKLWVTYKTLQNWFEAFESAFLVFELKKFSFSILRQQRSNSKIYIVDNWFYTLLFGHYKQDWGKLFENLIFLELRKAWLIENENIFYYKDTSFDIDFMIFKNWKILPVQVVYTLTEENYEREVVKLQRFVEKFNLEKWLVVVFEGEKRRSDNVEIVWFNDFIDYVFDYLGEYLEYRS